VPTTDGRLRIVVGGYLGLAPAGGLAWDYLHYPLGFAALGHDVFYVEDTRLWPVYQADGGGADLLAELRAAHPACALLALAATQAETARARFGVVGDGFGLCYTRTGRRFFDDRMLESEFLNRIRAAAERAGLWDELETDWMCLDCELMPWSAKAQELLRQQYAAVGAASRAALSDAVSALEKASAVTDDARGLLERYRQRAEAAEKYREAYRRYCWPVRSLDDLRLAPFHLLATEGKVHTDRDHVWHMETLRRLCGAVDTPLLFVTSYMIVDLTEQESLKAGISWWEDLTGRGGEGMVVKPLDFIARGTRGLVQPAVKCRGREYLRVIYGPEYDAPENLERLRARGLGAKRSLALREFALGVEGLERFVRREPLRRVHECVFGVLALESEPVDPRL